MRGASQPQAGAVAHLAWVYRPAATAVPDTLPGGPGRADQ